MFVSVGKVNENTLIRNPYDIKKTSASLQILTFFADWHRVCIRLIFNTLQKVSFWLAKDGLLEDKR